MASFTPVLVLEGLQPTAGEAEDAIELSEGRIAWMWQRQPAYPCTTADATATQGLNLAGELDAAGRLHISGRKVTPGWASGYGLLANGSGWRLARRTWDLVLADGERRDVDLDLALSREGSRRRLEGIFRIQGLEIMALAEGVGNPFEPGSFTGELYLISPPTRWAR